MTLKVLVVDDEPPARRHLRRLVDQVDLDCVVVGEAGAVDEAVELMVLQPDVVLLDVQMPGGSGFELFQCVEVRAAVIFVTAFDRHAVRAFEVNALDYLVKPVALDRLKQALGRANAAVAEPTVLLREDDLVSVRVSGGIRFLRVAEIVRIAAQDDYTELQLSKDSSLLSSMSIQGWLERLPTGRFVRIHRSTIVNLRYLEAIERSAAGFYQAKLRGVADPLRISRGYLEALRNRLEF